MEDRCLGIEVTYNVDQPVAKSYFQPKLGNSLNYMPLLQVAVIAKLNEKLLN